MAIIAIRKDIKGKKIEKNVNIHVNLLWQCLYFSFIGSETRAMIYSLVKYEITLLYTEVPNFAKPNSALALTVPGFKCTTISTQTAAFFSLI